MSNKFQPGQKVAYVPYHADGNVSHPDVELGTVSSTNEKHIFVRFDKTVARLGWDGTTSQACKPDQIISLGEESL